MTDSRLSARPKTPPEEELLTPEEVLAADLGGAIPFFVVGHFTIGEVREGKCEHRLSYRRGSVFITFKRAFRGEEAIAEANKAYGPYHNKQQMMGLLNINPKPFERAATDQSPASRSYYCNSDFLVIDGNFRVYRPKASNR